MLRKILAIIKKNFKLIIRTKSSALIVILGPLLLILLIGAAFNTANIYGIRVGTYSEEYSSLTNSLINELHKKRFSTIKIDSEEACKEGIKKGIIHVCAIFPPNFNIKSGGEVTFYVDNSRLNLVYIVLDTLSSVVGSKSKELSIQLTKTIIDALDFADQEIEDKKPLIAALSSDTKSSSDKIEKITLNLQNLNLEFEASSFNLGALEKEIGSLDLTENSSKSNANSLILNIKNQLKKQETELQKASESRNKAIKELGMVKSILTDNVNYLKIMDASSSAITSNIRNVKTTSISKIVSPIKTKIEPITKNKTHLNYIFPTLVILIIMFVSILLASSLEVREKTAKVFFKNFITPTSDLIFIISNFLTNLLIVILQLLVLFLVAVYFFRDQIIAVLGNIIAVILITATVFILLGMILGHIFKSEETNILAAISVGFILLFFSSAILPIETLPEIFGKIASYNPFLIGESLLNKVLLFQSSLQPLLSSIYILLSYIAGLFIIAIITKKLTKKSA